MTHKKPYLIILITIFFLVACKNVEEQSADVNEEKKENLKIDNTNSSSLLSAIEAAHGGWNHLYAKKDVEYHYEYTVSEGKADISTERYIFDGEISFGNYTMHQINTMPNDEGIVTHLFDGKNTAITLNGKTVENKQVVSIGQFVRRANYFWFVMPYKLNDPGTITKYLGTEVYNGIKYIKLEVTYDSDITKKDKNDIYILYVNPETLLIDRFYFSLPFLGVNTPVILADYEYKVIEGQQIAIKRVYFLPNSQGIHGKSPDITQKLSQFKFNNGFNNENISSK